MDCSTFKSPVGKLVKFFQESRDKWKQKCQQAKRENKKLQNQTRAVERSRDHWKQIAKDARQQARELQRQLEALKRAAHA